MKKGHRVVRFHYWTETNTNYDIAEDLLVHPTMQDVHQATRSNRDTATRSIWYPRVDVRTDRSAGAPTPYWWVGSTIYLAVVWDVDSSFPEVPINVGAGDPRIMGTVSLVPEAVIYDSSFDTAVTYRPQQGVLDLEGQRAGLGAESIPQVIGEVWGFDNYGVLDNSHGSHVVKKLSMISRVLWSSTVPPA